MQKVSVPQAPYLRLGVLPSPPTSTPYRALAFTETPLLEHYAPEPVCSSIPPMLASISVPFVRTNTYLKLLAVVLLLPAVSSATPSQPNRLPPLVPGEIIRYRVEYRSGIVSRAAGPISTPESAHRLSVSLTAVLRLDVLSVKQAAKQDTQTRLRVTYETCDARVESDAYDPGAEALQKQYESLQGHSFEFSIGPQGRVGDISGLESLESDPRARGAIRQWLSTLTLPVGLPAKDLKPGKKWTREVPVPDAPLAGIVWRTQSLYQQNRPCPPAPGAPATIAKEKCAVIGTKLDAVRHGDRNTTPLTYSRQGLRTSGRWLAHGESLSYVSLATGLVTSSTSTENNDMDITISTTLSNSQLRYAARTQSTSQITLVGFTRAPTTKPIQNPHP
ncbi:MAG: hypothetical protein KGL59_11350 [Acidobacteriota bacterium]|nr:hypothetical protein [Acidobacteriota bacterium]